MLDEVKLTAALDADWTTVKDFFGGFSKTVSDDTQTGGHAPSTTASQQPTGTSGRSRTSSPRRTRASTRGGAPEGAVPRMKTALQNAQTQQAWLQGQIASLPSY